jgi:hypothetical protein
VTNVVGVPDRVRGITPTRNWILDHATLDKHSRKMLSARFGCPDVEDCIALGVAFVGAIGQMIDTIV